MLNDFKKFISQGNVINLAIGVILGGAFSKVVSSLVDDILMPIIVSTTGAIDVSYLSLKIGNTQLMYGNFIQVVFSFLTTGFMLFLIIQPIEKMNLKRKMKQAAEEAKTPTETELLTEILAELKKRA